MMVRNVVFEYTDKEDVCRTYLMLKAHQILILSCQSAYVSTNDF